MVTGNIGQALTILVNYSANHGHCGSHGHRIINFLDPALRSCGASALQWEDSSRHPNRDLFGRFTPWGFHRNMLIMSMISCSVKDATNRHPFWTSLAWIRQWFWTPLETATVEPDNYHHWVASQALLGHQLTHLGPQTQVFRLSFRFFSMAFARQWMAAHQGPQLLLRVAGCCWDFHGLWFDLCLFACSSVFCLIVSLFMWVCVLISFF